MKLLIRALPCRLFSKVQAPASSYVAERRGLAVGGGLLLSHCVTSTAVGSRSRSSSRRRRSGQGQSMRSGRRVSQFAPARHQQFGGGMAFRLQFLAPSVRTSVPLAGSNEEGVFVVRAFRSVRSQVITVCGSCSCAPADDDREREDPLGRPSRACDHLRPTPTSTNGSGVCEPDDGHGAVPLSNRFQPQVTLAALRVDGARLKFDRLGLPLALMTCASAVPWRRFRAWSAANVAAFSWFLRRDHGAVLSTITRGIETLVKTICPTDRSLSRPSRLILPARPPGSDRRSRCACR